MNQEDWHRLNIRIPQEIERKLKKASEKHNRSVTGEIVRRLDASFKDEELNEDDIKSSVRETAAKIEILIKKILIATEKDDTLKTQLLTDEESNLLKVFKNATPKEKEFISSLLKKMR